MATPDVDNLTKVFISRYDRIWKLYFSGKRDVALTMAPDLLMEPKLGSAHQASMHQLLACGPLHDDTVMHAQEAVRIDSEILQQYRDTAKLHEKALETRLRFAKEHLELVLEKKRNFEADMAQWIARECLMADAQDAQLEQAERDEQAKRTAAQEDDGNPGDLLPPSYVTAADVGVLLRSGQNVTPDTASINEKSSQDRPQSTATVEAASPPVLHIHASDKEKS